jgi:SulP family sulfate permease
MKVARGRNWSWWGEFSGAFGDLGIMLPLASALALSAGFGVSRLFFLWGLAYVATGVWFRVPVSVQPLKAMAILAIGLGIDAATLSNAAVGYGILFLLLTVTGLVPRIQSWFSPGLVRGVQLGIGLVLARKAFGLVQDADWLLGGVSNAGHWSLAIATITVFVLAGARWWKGWNLTLPVIAFAILGGVVFGGALPPVSGGSLVQWQTPSPSAWGQLFILLMLPQLPLTLGNAVVAANDACHEYWPGRAARVSVGRLAASIGLGNLLIGFLGGFPMCHGAGGIAAHHRFGGRTGWTTVILGSGLIGCALIPGAAGLVLRIPVPVLAGLLMMVAWEMVRLVGRPAPQGQIAVAVVTGIISFATKNLAIGLAAGWILERTLAFPAIAVAMSQARSTKP